MFAHLQRFYDDKTEDNDLKDEKEEVCALTGSVVCLCIYWMEICLSNSNLISKAATQNLYFAYFSTKCECY